MLSLQAPERSARGERPAGRRRMPAPPRGPLVTVLGLLVLAGLSAWLRSLDNGTTFWIDEGLSVGIADRPAADIPSVLRQDGSPPLYYLLLHFWMALAGRGEEATHLLSLLFAVLAVPAAFWALRPFGARAGWYAAVLAAANPFLTAYAQETRMYTLVVALGLLALGAFVRAFAGTPGIRAGAAFGVALAALLYTHNWALFFAAACGLAWLGLLATADAARRRGLLRAGLAGFGLAGALYLPWLPTTLFQAAHTGAPWATRPGLDAIGAVFGRLLGREGQIVLLLAAGAGLVAVWTRSRASQRAAGQVIAARREQAGPGTAAPGGKSRRVAGTPFERRALTAVAGIFAGTVLIAWLASQISPAWALRYLAVCVAPLLVLAAGGLARAGRLGLAGLAVVAVLWAADGAPTDKSNAAEVMAWLEPALEDGDLVVSTQPEQIPVLDYYLDEPVRWATLWGRVADAGVTDWRDGVRRLEATTPERDLGPLIEGLEPGQRLALVTPIFEDRRQWSAPWTELVRWRSQEWRRYAGNHPGLELAARYPPTSYPDRPNPVAAAVYVRTPRG